MAVLNSCGGCPHKWQGTQACHCPTCHYTFSGESTFKLHRSGGMCLDPRAVGLVPVVGRTSLIWGTPSKEPEAALPEAA